MRQSRRAAAALIGVLLSTVVSAAPQLEVVRKTVKAITSQDVEKVEKSSIPGLYEVHTKTELFYTDEQGKYVLFGAHVFSTADNSNYSERRVAQIVNYKFGDLQLKDAIKIVTGTGERTVVSIEDPNCGYCKRFTKTVGEAGNVTQYVFLVGILGDDSKKKAKDIWCSADPAKTWRDWMVDGKAVAAAPDCAAPIERNGALLAKYRVNGTPSLFFTNGERAPGALPLDELEKRLARSRTDS